MRLKQLCFAALTCLFVMSSQASAQNVTSTAEPETDITVFVFTNFAFSQYEGNNNGGGRFLLRDSTTTFLNNAGDAFGSGSRDLRFSVSGVSADMMGIKGDTL